MPALWTDPTHHAWCLDRNFPSMALLLAVSLLPAARGELMLPWWEDEEQGILCRPLLIKQPGKRLMSFTCLHEMVWWRVHSEVMNSQTRIPPASTFAKENEGKARRDWTSPAIFLQILTREQSSICNQIRGIISVIKVNWESKWKNLMLFMLIYFRLEKVKPEVNTKRRSMEREAWQRQKTQIWAIIGVGLH